MTIATMNWTEKEIKFHVILLVRLCDLVVPLIIEILHTSTR